VIGAVSLDDPCTGFTTGDGRRPAEILVWPKKANTEPTWSHMTMGGTRNLDNVDNVDNVDNLGALGVFAVRFVFLSEEPCLKTPGRRASRRMARAE
jgi:hypothetical protein